MKKKLSILLAGITLVLLLVACAAPAPAPAPTPAPPAEPVKIGHLASFTGHSAAANPWIISGIELAIDEFGGEVAGRPIELINEDSASDPTVSVDKAKKLLEVDKVDVIIGPLPANGLVAVSAFLVDSGIPHLGICQNVPPAFEMGDHVFAHEGTHRGNGYPAGFYAYDEMGARTATVIHDDIIFAEEFTQGAMDGFVSRGGQILQRQRTAMDTMDYGPYLTAMKKADVVLLWLVPDNAFRLIKQYYEYGYDMPLVFSGLLTLGENQRADIGDDILGLISAYSSDAGIDTPEVRAFIDRWLEVNGHKSAGDGRFPDFAEGLSGYMSARIFLEAVEATNGDTSPAALKAALRSIKVDGPWGPVSFNEKGIGIGNMHILAVFTRGYRYINDSVFTYEQILRAEPDNIRDAAPKM